MEQLDFSQSYPINTEAENYDDPVEFLNEVRVPCLICCADTEIDNIVKQEVDQFDEDTANNQEYHLGVDGGSVYHEIFHYFLKWFSVDITKNGKQRLIDRGWDGEGGDILRFCGTCKMELKGILELQKQLDELQEKVKNGLVVVKGRMEKFEEAFQSNGAYDKDHRYKMVRSWILKNETANLGHPTQNQRNVQSSRKPVDQSSKRRSPRIKTKSNSPKILSNIPTSVKTSPTKLAMKVAQQKKGPLTITKIVRKLVRKKRNSRIPVNLHKKIKKIQSPVSRVKSPRNTTKRNVVRSNNETIAATVNVDDLPLDKVLSSSKAIAEQRIIPNDSGLRPGASFDVIVYAKKSPSKMAKKLEEKVCRRKSTRIAKKIIQQNVHVRDPPTSTNKLRNMRVSKISENVTTAYETTDIKDNHESSEDDNSDVERKSKKFDKKYSYELDSLANTISCEGIQFSISSDREKVCCTLCNFSLSNTIGSIRRHFIKHHSNRFACSQCSFRGPCKSRLDNHIKSVHQSIPVIQKIPCRICGKPIWRPRDHEWTHMSKKEQKKVLQKEPKRIPYYRHRNKKCEECGKRIPAQEMRDHKLKYHKRNGCKKPKEKCPQCGKSFLRLKEHIKYTHGPAKYQCTEQGCGRTFKKLSWLTRHKDFVHRKLRPWKCTKCTRQFSREFYLKQHMDLHMGKRRWKCEVKRCGAAFMSKWSLKGHHKKFHEEGSKPVRKFFLRGPNKSSREVKDQKGK